MKWLLNALTSSIGRKFVMAITGLLLCGFLVVHLAGNLLLLVGAQQYNSYAHNLHKQEGLLMIAETGLFALFIIHILIAFKLTVGNKLARGQGYAVQQFKGEGDGVGFGRPDTWMAISGVLVLGYIILHLIDFKLQLRGDISYNGLEPFDKAVRILRTPTSTIGYLAGFVFLGLHLMHGIPSVFQTLGLNHKKYNGLIRIGGLLFVAGLVLGNAVIVGWAVTLPQSKVLPLDATSTVDGVKPHGHADKSDTPQADAEKSAEKAAETDKPGGEKPADEKPAVDKQATEKPADSKPTAEKPAAPETPTDK